VRSYMDCATPTRPNWMCAELHQMHHSAAAENVVAASIWVFAAVREVSRLLPDTPRELR
jgi:hypothetical protein